MVFKIFRLGKTTNMANEHLNDIPVIAEETDYPTVTTADIDVTWQTTDSPDQDAININNWNKIIEIVDASCNLKNEEDLKSIILVSPFWIPVFESRRLFLEQCESQEGIGPKRMKLLRKMLKVWVPFSRKALPRRQDIDEFRPGNASSYCKNGRSFNPPHAPAKFEFVRWALV